MEVAFLKTWRVVPRSEALLYRVSGQPSRASMSWCNPLHTSGVCSLLIHSPRGEELTGIHSVEAVGPYALSPWEP